MRLILPAAVGLCIATTLSPAWALPYSPASRPDFDGRVILVQRSMPREIVPLVANDVAAIEKAITAVADHPYPAEDAATGDARKLLDKSDYVGAHDAFVALALKGNTAAVYMLGVMYTGARGVKQDFPLAAKLFLICGEANEPFCQNALVDIYKTGKGVPRDPGTAQAWLDRFHKNPFVHAADPVPK